VPGKLTSCEDDLTRLVHDHQEESFSYKEVQFKMFCSPVKTSCPSVENISKSHNNIAMWQRGPWKIE